MLGGLEIPHTHGLLGHSDADVLLHSITDAILGALAMGDIGAHFPDTDPEWKGADSADLLRRIMVKVEKAGYRVGNIDATVVTERPKLRAYIDDIRKSIADILNVDLSAVSVKATTNEKMGFTGREEGMAVHAVALMKAIASDSSRTA